jgi:hypothetical protein
MATLDQVRDSILVALAQTEQREQLLIALQSPDEQRAAERAVVWGRTLEDLAHRLGGFRDQAGRADRQAAAAEATAVALDPLWQRWTGQLESVRRRLAEPPTGLI